MGRESFVEGAIVPQFPDGCTRPRHSNRIKKAKAAKVAKAANVFPISPPPLSRQIRRIPDRLAREFVFTTTYFAANTRSKS